jgi:uncharacterized repeat protein (TIGR03943 family)
VTARTQAVVVALLAAVLIRLVWSGEYLRFVRPWMGWPLLATGAVLLLLALRPALGRGGSAERVPGPTWLLLVPTVIVFAVAPPPLGAYLAERRDAELPPGYAAPKALPAVDDGTPLDLGIDEFVWGAAQVDDVMGLTGRTVQMDGFVSSAPDGGWYLTRLEIYCCAADAVVEHVAVEDQPAPPRDAWVRVTGTWVPGTGGEYGGPARLSAEAVVRIKTPDNPYG